MTQKMHEIFVDYESLFDQLLAGHLNISEFQSKYLSQFKSERRPLAEPLYELLEGLFGDVDSFTTDQELLASNPAFFIDEKELREKVGQAAARLLALANDRSNGPAQSVDHQD